MLKIQQVWEMEGRCFKKDQFKIIMAIMQNNKTFASANNTAGVTEPGKMLEREGVREEKICNYIKNDLFKIIIAIIYKVTNLCKCGQCCVTGGTREDVRKGKREVF